MPEPTSSPRNARRPLDLQVSGNYTLLADMDAEDAAAPLLYTDMAEDSHFFKWVALGGFGGGGAGPCARALADCAPIACVRCACPRARTRGRERVRVHVRVGTCASFCESQFARVACVSIKGDWPYLCTPDATPLCDVRVPVAATACR